MTESTGVAPFLFELGDFPLRSGAVLLGFASRDAQLKRLLADR